MKSILLQRIAIGCGAVPLIAGTAIYLAWRATRWDAFEFLGLMNILIGLMLFVVGIACLYFQENQDRSAADAPDTFGRHRSAFTLALLLANFPAAAIFGLSALEVMDRYTVRVVNESGGSIEDLTLSGPSIKEYPLGEVAANSRERCILRIRSEGGLNFSAKQHGEFISGELDGYAMSGRDITLHLLPDGKFEVRDNDAISYLARD